MRVQIAIKTLGHSKIHIMPNSRDRLCEGREGRDGKEGGWRVGKGRGCRREGKEGKEGQYVVGRVTVELPDSTFHIH